MKKIGSPRIKTLSLLMLNLSHLDKNAKTAHSKIYFQLMTLLHVGACGVRSSSLRHIRACRVTHAYPIITPPAASGPPAPSRSNKKPEAPATSPLSLHLLAVAVFSKIPRTSYTSLYNSWDWTKPRWNFSQGSILVFDKAILPSEIEAVLARMTIRSFFVLGDHRHHLSVRRSRRVAGASIERTWPNCLIVTAIRLCAP